MATTYKDMISEQVPATNSAIYTAGTLSSAHIMAATVYNTSASNVSIQVNIVQSGGSVASTNRYSSHIIPAGSERVLYELIGLILNTGDYISVVAGSASALNFKGTIKEITT